MLLECRQEFLEHVIGVDHALCLGYDVDLEDVLVGMTFVVSPNFVWPDYTDAFTVNNAMKHSNWQLTETVACHHNDHFEILRIVKSYRKPKFQKPHIRVRNLRTMDDFNIIVSDDTLEQHCTNNFYFLPYYE